MISLIANLILPFLILFIILYGLLKRKEMYDPFLKGAADGFRIVAEVAPTLIALFFAIQIFRSSGALIFWSGFCLLLPISFKSPPKSFRLSLQNYFPPQLPLDFFWISSKFRSGLCCRLPLFYHIKFHGNLLLYYVCLLFLCPYQKNPLHALRRSDRHLRRDHCIHCLVPFLLFLKKRRFCSYRNLLLILFF